MAHDLPTRDEVTHILQRAESGDQAASEELLPLVYGELRRLANDLIAREKPGQTLQATALVHEAYVRLLGPIDSEGSRWDNRGHFFVAAAQAMRRILVDRARARGAMKRGGGAPQLRLDPESLTLNEVPGEIIDLDDALRRLAEAHPDKANLVSLRFFGGLTMKQAAAALDIAPATADRHWAFARAWLYHELSKTD